MCTPRGVETTGAAVAGHRLQQPAGALGAFVSDADPIGGAMNAAKQAGLKIVGCGFTNLSQRMQLVLGAGQADEVMMHDLGNLEVRQRGRIRITSYNTGAGHSGLVRWTAATQPNLDPPSFMYLQMTVPGTRSKILGMSDERGGWAVPTAPNQYISNYVNFPTGLNYHFMMVRSMPFVTNVATYNAQIKWLFQ